MSYFAYSNIFSKYILQTSPVLGAGDSREEAKFYLMKFLSWNYQ